MISGTLAGVPVQDVVDEKERIAHVLGGAAPSGTVQCEIDWARRFDHMQQHSGQHLLSAVLLQLYKIETISFHLGAESSTIDVQAPAVAPEQLHQAEERANDIVFENIPLNIRFAAQSPDLGLRKIVGARRRAPDNIDRGLDRSACGGTHVRSTAEIGPVVVRKVEKIRGNVRIEFLCGIRAIRRGRADYEALSKVARLFSAALDEAPAVVSAQMQRLQELEKLSASYRSKQLIEKAAICTHRQYRAA